MKRIIDKVTKYIRNDKYDKFMITELYLIKKKIHFKTLTAVCRNHFKQYGDNLHVMKMYKIYGQYIQVI